MSLDPATFEPEHFLWAFDGGVATITLNRPERKNPLTFDSYAELRDTFRALGRARPRSRCVVIAGAGGNFCSGGDVHEIIGPLTKMDRDGLLEFTRMTGDLVEAMRACPQPIVAAVEGVCAGAGAIIAMASDLRLTPPDVEDRLPVHPRRPERRGHGRLRDPAADHRPRPRRRTAVHRPHRCRAEEGERWGFYNRVCATTCTAKRRRSPRQLASGPTYAHAVTKRQLDAEWNVSIDRGARRWRPRPRPIAWRPSDFQPRLRGLRGQAHAGVRGRLMADRSFLDWPFFESATASCADSSSAGARPIRSTHGGDLDAECRGLVAELGDAGFLKLCVADGDQRPDVRSLAIARETLARHSGLADFAFAMQGLGLGRDLACSGRVEQKARMAAPGRRRRGDRRLRHDRARMRIRRRQHRHDRDRATATTGSSTARRPTSPTAASPIST